MKHTSFAHRAQVNSKTFSWHDGPRQQFLDFDAASSAALAVPLPAEDAATRLARRFCAELAADPHRRFDNVAFANLAREYFGSAAGHGRDAYDAAEAGLNLYLDRLGLDLAVVPQALDRLLALEGRLPRQTTRDQRQIDFQQFSTPPAEALVVVKAAALRAGMTVLEPSAGTGNIAVLARMTGAQVETNEIDPRRRSLLALHGFTPLEVDAERLDNLLPVDRTYHAIVMNPPFSATGGRVNGHRTEFGARHIEQALLRLKPGGRLVALVGQGMAHDRPLFQRWWAEIESRYHVRANVGMDGNQYARFGTTFDHQLIVIDQGGPTTNSSDIVAASGLSVHSAYEVLKHLAEEDVYGRVCQQDTSVRSGEPATTVSPGRGDPPRPGTDCSTRGRARHVARSLFDPSGPVASLEHARDGSGAGTRSATDEHPGRGTALHSRGDPSDESLGRESHRGDARPVRHDIGELETALPCQAVDIEEGTVFAAYRVQKAVVRGALPHPANVVESTAMACVEPPDVTYRHRLPADVIVEGRVSNLQLEDVIYAGQATSIMLPDGSRKGHWNGDGTGIGKGREIYAFLYDQFAHGLTKHVHISASHQLLADAKRDCSAVGLPLPLIHQADFKTGEAIPAAAGVLFTTYTLLSHDLDGERARFEQLIAWLGVDFDGVIAFDEAHLMKNAAATPHGGKSTVDHGTLRGNMGIALQRMFPEARVRYFSATGATEARHMAPYERLGLWGAGAPFADFSAFLTAMERGGVAAMEMLCRDLKSVGTYLSRTISYGPTRLADGSVVPHSAVEYEPLLHRLTAAETQQYNRIADLWADLLTAFETAERNACQGRNSHRYAQFYSVQQRFFLQLMMAYTLPDVLPAIETDLRQGRSVVLSLFNTGEAQADRKVRAARAEGIEISELDATPREMMVQLIENQFPIYQYTETTDPLTGNVVRVRVEDRAGNPEINRENERRQRALLDQVADLDFPQNPLDAILARFGAGQVAEISGRTHRFENGKYVRRKLSGLPHRQLNAYETRLFQDGAKRVAVLSGAGSVGISVHADVRAKNQDRRVFYAFQLSWSADQQMQAFGRVHRSNQTSAPVIRLVLLDLAGQKRLVNSVSKRLAALGALTKGERHSLSSDLFRPEDVTDEYGKAALGRLYRQIETGQHQEDGIGLATLDRMGVLNQEKTAVRESYAANVEQFLNRIMVLHVETQNRLFELFYERYVAAVAVAQRQSAFDFGVEEIRAHNLRQMRTPETLFVDAGSGARTLLHELEGEVEVVRHAFDSVAEGALGFYRNRRSERIYAASESHGDFDGSVYLTGVKGPRRSLEQEELAEKYEPVALAEARTWWNQEYERTPQTELRTFHLLSGAVFPIYDKVMGSSGIQSVKIARAILADGQALVGLNLSPDDVPQVKLRLGIGTPLGAATAEEILGLVKGGSLIELDNGWQLTTSRIAGDDVVEINLCGVPANREELLAYGFSEEIIRYKRHWFAVLDEADVVIAKLLVRHKAVKDVTSANLSEETPPG